MDRYLGYVKAMLRAGLPIRDDWRLEDRDDQGKFMPFSLPHEMPDAFVCASDYVACILMQLLEKRGLRVPEDVAVSGFDNNIEDLLAENLTTVQVFNEELGSRLALQILYRIKYPHTPHEVTYLESKVLYRASTGD